VSPGNTYFEGGIWQNIERGMPDLYKTAMSLNPTGRMGTAQEVAAGVVFLASPVASRISGTNLIIDGALTKGVHLLKLPSNDLFTATSILRAMAQQHGPVGLVHVDAHTDINDTMFGERIAHGTPFRRAVEEGLLDPKRTIQIGIRGAQNSDEGWRYSLESGMRVVFIEEFEARGVGAIIDEARKVVGDGPTYLSLDVDGLDPVYTPGTGTPEIGGLTTRETLALLRGLDGLNWVGGDVVEVSPPYDPSGNTALVAATLMYEILCLLARRFE